MLHSHFNTNIGKFKQPDPVPLEVIGRVFDDLSDEKAIDKLLVKNKRERKIQELLDAQLLLPVESRNKTLMKKMGFETDVTSKIDNWPPDIDDVSCYLDVYFPVDKSIPIGKRPLERYKNLGEFKDSNLNSYYYYFPISRDQANHTGVYKIDNQPVWIYSDGTYDEDRSDVNNIYCALFDLMKGNDEEALEKFSKLGLLDNNGLVKYKMTGKNLIVEYIIKNVANGFKTRYEDESSNTGQGPQEVDISDVSDDDVSIDPADTAGGDMKTEEVTAVSFRPGEVTESEIESESENEIEPSKLSPTAKPVENEIEDDEDEDEDDEEMETADDGELETKDVVRFTSVPIHKEGLSMAAMLIGQNKGYEDYETYYINRLSDRPEIGHKNLVKLPRTYYLYHTVNDDDKSIDIWRYSHRRGRVNTSEIKNPTAFKGFVARYNQKFIDMNAKNYNNVKPFVTRADRDTITRLFVGNDFEDVLAHPDDKVMKQ